ncbi:DMT family transporter [Variovorax humicola]|uniref:DMT family transporter n=1 Tax=Variovorax humicola TaxID=1769758 RepID=A0ABU8W7Z7_9BURK
MYSVAWMLLATSSFTLMAFIIKLQSPKFSVADILFLRSTSSIAFVLGLNLFFRFRLRTRVFSVHARRSICGLVSMSTWYYTLGVLPMGVSVTLNYMSPLFLGLILYWVGGQQSRPTRSELAFVLLGFFGVLIMLNPFGSTLGASDVLPVLLGVAAAFVAALAFKDVRALKNAGENEWQMVFYFSMTAALFSFPLTSLARLEFTAQPVGYVLLGVAGIFGALGQFGVSKAFGSGSQIVSASLQYLSVVFSLLLSWLVLDERVSIAQVSGIALITCAAVMTIAASQRRVAQA